MSLLQLATSAAAHLNDLEYFANASGAPPKPVPVLTELKGDIANEIDQRLNTIGIGVILMAPEIEVQQPDRPKANAVIKFVAQVGEQPIVNQGSTGTGKPALNVCHEIAKALHFRQFESFGRLELQRIILVEETPILVYHVEFLSRLTITPNP